MSTKEPEPSVARAGRLQRSVGFYGLMMVSLGSIIGSGWLLGALNAAERAGPASVLSWILAAGMLSLLALVYAELGATYPVAGGAARFPYYSHGSVAGFTAGWASWLQAVFIAPLEVLAAITYVNSVGWVNQHFNMIFKVGENAGLLNGTGLRRRDRPDGGVHRDQSGGRQVPLRQQHHRRHLEDGRALSSRSASWPRCSSSRRTSTRAAGSCRSAFTASSPR